MAGNRQEKEKDILGMFVRKDKSAAMRALFDEYSGYLTAVCLRYVPDTDVRKDILQEAFIRIYTGIGRFKYQGKGSLKAWMARIVANEALQYLRKENKNIFDTQDIASLPFDLPEEEPDISDISEDTLLKMISGLPDGYRTVFNLYVFEEMSHKEIAAALNIKADSSASQFYRAKAMLAKKINEYRKQSQNHSIKAK